MALGQLLASGCQLTIWIQGSGETPLPWGSHDPGRFSDLPPHTTVVSRGSPDEIDALRTAAPEFLLQLDQEPPAPQLLQAAPRGIWRFAWEGPGPLAFWALLDNLYHLEVRLEQLTERPGLRVALERRWIRLVRHSYDQTLDQLFSEMAEMPAYVLQCGPRNDSEPAPFPPSRVVPPTAIDRARLRAKLLSRSLRRQLSALFFSETWRVGTVEAPIESFADLDYLPAPRWLPSPGRNHFLADPFLISHSGGYLLLAEDYDFGTDRGRIVQESSANGRFSGRMREAMAMDCHMSYPFLLRQGDDLYCLPETHQKDGLFAWRWDPVSEAWSGPRPVLSGIACIDATPVYFEGRWWLFCTNHRDGVDHKLHVYFAEKPWGPWKPHARNPVKVDIRSSRPAGTPFLLRGHLYRPAQDSSKHYGWRLCINRVTRLTPLEFDEEPIRVLDSDRLGVSGIHTLSGDRGMCVIDARHPRFTPWRFSGVLRHKMRKLAFFLAHKVHLHV